MVPDHPNVWSDSSLVLDRITNVSSSGSGIFAHQSESCWSGRRWGHVDRVRPKGEVQSCKGFCSFPGPLQSVQRAVMWRVILALQSSGAVHHGDLLLLIEKMLHLRGLDTVRIAKVKGHADEGMVLDGRDREVDRLGNDAADEAADFSRRRVGNAVIDARRNLSGGW